MSDAPKGPAFLPPLLYLAIIGSAYLLQRFIPLRITPGSTFQSLGLGVVAVAVLFAFWAFMTFRSAGTTVEPRGTASALVRHGPFRFTRNPMYLSLTTIQAAAGLAFNSWWPIILLPLSVGLMTSYVIQREELRLEHWFGEEYRAYKDRVRRWI